MKEVTIKIGKREFALAFTLDAMAQLEKTIEGFNLGDLAQYPRTAKGLGDMIFAMAQQGELLAGRTLDVDRTWIGAHMSPSPAKVTGYQLAVLDCLNAALAMETEEGEEGEQDEVLNEIKKK